MKRESKSTVNKLFLHSDSLTISNVFPPNFSFDPEPPPSEWHWFQSDLFPFFRLYSLTTLYLILNLCWEIFLNMELTLESGGIFWHKLAKQCIFSYTAAATMSTIEGSKTNWIVPVLILLGYICDMDRGLLGSHPCIFALYLKQTVILGESANRKEWTVGIVIHADVLQRDIEEKIEEENAVNKVYQGIVFSFLVFASCTSAQWKGFLIAAIIVIFTFKYPLDPPS